MPPRAPLQQLGAECSPSETSAVQGEAAVGRLAILEPPTHLGPSVGTSPGGGALGFALQPRRAEGLRQRSRAAGTALVGHRPFPTRVHSLSGGRQLQEAQAVPWAAAQQRLRSQFWRPDVREPRPRSWACGRPSPPRPRSVRPLRAGVLVTPHEDSVLLDPAAP